MKRDTKNGTLETGGRNTLPWPNFAHGARVISAKPSGAVTRWKRGWLGGQDSNLRMSVQPPLMVLEEFLP